jgi:hypothetical protein
MTRETGPGDRRAVRTSVVLGSDLDIDVILAAVDVAILDAAVGKMDLLVEVRQVMVVRPLLDLAPVAFRPSIGVRPVPITFVEPLLVLALQLVVQPHALDLQTPRLEPRRLALIGAVDLGVVFQLALAFEPRIERLTRIPIAVSIRIQHAPAAVRQNHGLFTVARDSYGFDQTLFAEVSEVAVTWIRWSVVTVSEVAGRHDAKNSDGRERATLRSPESVFAITSVVDDFAVTAAGQVEPAREHFPRVVCTVPRIAIALRPARIVAIAVVRTITCSMPIVVTVTTVMAAVALVPVIRVARIACVIVVARIEVHIALGRG